MKALFLLYLANVKEFTRERVALFWTFAFPISFVLLFGLIYSATDNAPEYEIGLANEDHGAASESLVKVFLSVGAFKVTEGSRSDIMDKLQNGDLRAVILIPQGMSEATAAGQPTKLDVFYDPSNQTTSQVVLSIIEKVVESYDQKVSNRPRLVSISPQSVISTNLGAIDFLLPGIIAMSLMQLGLFTTANVLVELREKQVLRRLGATPLPRSTLLSSQVLFRLTIGIVQTLSIIVVGISIFNVNLQSDLTVLMGVVLLGALMFIALGYMISGLARSQDSVSAITNLVQFPMLFLSGIFFPIEFLPDWIMPVVKLLPITYLADMLRQVMVGATPSFPIALDLAVVSGWLVVCSLLAVKFFRWE